MTDIISKTCVLAALAIPQYSINCELGTLQLGKVEIWEINPVVRVPATLGVGVAIRLKFFS
jgi:hypothetical protein